MTASLRFSLKESVWFQKGQEVAQLLSISLDPDITIQERDYEVVIKGELLLTGEYLADETEEPAFSLRELSPVRTVDRIEQRDDGINELYHAFPLEISIPRSRVNMVEDLVVDIESFDYELPEKGCLRLLADLYISGLCEEDERKPENHEEENEVPIATADFEEEDLFEPFQLEMRRTPAVEEPPAVPQIPQREPASPQVELFGRPDKPQEQPKKEEEPVYSQRDENALYLTKLFGKNEEEAFSKVRMYFVQQGDTLESIADKYGVQVQQLYRLNHTEDLYVSQGQILYVPVKRSKTSS
ncbi:stage VI sporulation protein D [Ectobacillus ponti]|uniref:Stage VI sporulation protein D n=1 Tax=Ectobacillus ponti TaxID=2961894 RepID=A0AA42BND2_9BACI|nr:stage VI sporulation protein D [Ectobacillus ponti]MCP8967331.1 stage VI sporulation protein D [Ectobacillus ponti]